jgi:Holliday junction resolvase-like predicted endonuclease
MIGAHAMPMDLSHIARFWNAEPPNGACHRLVRPHNWDSNEINKLNRQGIAILGENITAKWAEAGSWVILHRQKRHRGFELDLVIQQKQSLRIVEVKTRLYPNSAPDLNAMESWLNYKKKCALIRGTKFILNQMGRMANHLESISCELVAIDILKNKHIAVYRWPNACPLD